MLFGKRLKQFRTQAGLLQEDLAKRSGVHHITISRIEQNGEGCKIGTARKLAKGLKIPLAWFFIEENRADEAVA